MPRMAHAGRTNVVHWQIRGKRHRLARIGNCSNPHLPDIVPSPPLRLCLSKSISHHPHPAFPYPLTFSSVPFPQMVNTCRCSCSPTGS